MSSVEPQEAKRPVQANANLEFSFPDYRAYRQRTIVERFPDRIKDYRGIVTSLASAGALTTYLAAVKLVRSRILCAA